MRHALKKDKEGTKVYPASHDGRNAGRMRGDWEGLERVLNADGRGSNADAGRLEHFSRDGQYPSIYFRALHKAMKACGGMEAQIDALPALAEAACTYARAMRVARMSPEALREHPQAGRQRHTMRSRCSCATSHWHGGAKASSSRPTVITCGRTCRTCSVGGGASSWAASKGWRGR